MENIILSNDDIQAGDFIINIINGEELGTVVRCKSILSGYDLVWESIDGKVSMCGAIFLYRKVANYIPNEMEMLSIKNIELELEKKAIEFYEYWYDKYGNSEIDEIERKAVIHGFINGYKLAKSNK